MKLPNSDNNFLEEHANLLISSYQKLTGRLLITNNLNAESLFLSEFCVLSHNTDDIPIFNYANERALDLFEMSWEKFTTLESRKSAEPVNRDIREKIMNEVTENGFIANYSGIRISATGTRFMIKNTTIWNVIDDQGKYCGQAALIRNWTKI